MTHFHYLYNSEFSCIIKLSDSGTELQRISIPRSDLMKLALVCWENSIDKLESEREQQKYNIARKRLHRVKKLCYNSRRRLSLAVFQVMQQQLSGIVGDLTMQPEMFDYEHEADEKRKSYEYKFNFGEVELKIEPVVEYVDEEKIS